MQDHKSVSQQFKVYKGDKPYIFISYSHEDSEEVYHAIEVLYKLGFRIWFDKSNSREEDINLAFFGCSYFLIFISHHSIKSNLMREKIALAIQKEKQCLVIYLTKIEKKVSQELGIYSMQSIQKYKSWLSKDEYYSNLVSILFQSKAKLIEPKNKRDLIINSYIQFIEPIIMKMIKKGKLIEKKLPEKLEKKLLTKAMLMGLTNEDALEIIEEVVTIKFQKGIGKIEENKIASINHSIADFLVQVRKNFSQPVHLDREYIDEFLKQQFIRANRWGIPESQLESILKREISLKFLELCQLNYIDEAKHILIYFYGDQVLNAPVIPFLLHNSGLSRDFLYNFLPDKLEDHYEDERKKANEMSTLLLSAGGAGGGSSEPSISDVLIENKKNVSIADKVHFSVTSPHILMSGRNYEVDVWAHFGHQRDKVIQRACEESADKDIRIKGKGPVEVARGSELVIRLKIKKLKVDYPEDTIYWDGEIANTTFIVEVPEKISPGTLPGVATIHVKGFQIARVSFVVNVGLKEDVSKKQLEAKEDRIRKVFASYASEDRDEVIARIQGLIKAMPDIDIFLDVVNLRSGENWKERIRDEIVSRDVLYLFWSHAASRSKWVEWEWRTALKEKGINFIDPFPIVSPDEVQPPKELSDELHFNDWILSFKRGHSINK